MSSGAFHPPIEALRSRKSAGVMWLSRNACRPYWTPTLSHVERAKPDSGSRPYTLTASFQCVHSTAACCSAVMPGTVPKWGFSASGESPRQPLMHSVEPGNASHGVKNVQGMLPVTFATTVFDVLSPSSHERFVHTRHFDVGPSCCTRRSIQCSSSSQSPTWIVCVTMSGYEYCGIAPSSSPGWFWPYTYCWIAPPDPPRPTVYTGSSYSVTKRDLTISAVSPPRTRL